MLTFSSLGSGGVRVEGGKKSVVAFPKEGVKGASKADLTLMPSPEEHPPEGVLSWPGEYNEAGITIRGVGHDEGQQVSYTVEIDGTRVGLLSSPLKDWSEKQIESAPDLDVLIIPTGNPKIVQKLVDEFDPRVLLLVPADEKADLAGLSKTLGVRETVKEFKVKSLPAEGREAVVLA